MLCERQPNLAFFSGFHRHGALRDPVDSFTANFCHPNAITALLGARLLDRISPNFQVSPGVHNVEVQYSKAAKNISSIFANTNLDDGASSEVTPAYLRAMNVIENVW